MKGLRVIFSHGEEIGGKRDGVSRGSVIRLEFQCLVALYTIDGIAADGVFVRVQTKGAGAVLDPDDLTPIFNAGCMVSFFNGLFQCVDLKSVRFLGPGFGMK